MKITKSKARKILISYLITFAACLLADIVLCLAKTKVYASQVVISDEPKQTDILVGLDRMTAWINKGALDMDKKGMDNPEVYPKLLQSPDFIAKLSKTRLKGLNCTLYEYISKKKADDVYDEIKENIQFSIRPFVHTITIQYTDNDPYVAYSVLDSMISLLQRELNNRKTGLNALLLDGAKKSKEQAKSNYKKLQKKYADLYDSESESNTPGIEIKLKQLERERDAAFALYEKESEKVTRYEYLELRKNNSFSIISNNFMPTKPISPKPFPYFMSILLMGLLLNTWGVLFYLKFLCKEED